MAALRQPDDPREAAKQVLAELLPLDPERQAENEVWLAFTARALVDPKLRALRDQAYDLLRDACQRWVSQLLPKGASELVIDLKPSVCTRCSTAWQCMPPCAQSQPTPWGRSQS